LSVTLLSFASITGCGGQALVGSEQQEFGGVTPSDAGTGPSAGADPACSQPETGPIALRSVDQVQSLIVGRWLLCGDKTIFGTPNTAGIEFATDGAWYQLYRVGAALERGAAFDKFGTWEILDHNIPGNGPGAYSVSMVLKTGVSNVPLPIFAETPQKMRLNDPYSGPYDYVRAAPAP
jgi:hypothetical protein